MNPGPRTQALLRGDWDAFWAALGLSVTDDDRRFMETSSDPRALGAVDLGALRSRYAIDLSRITAPSLLYCSGQEAASPRFAGDLRTTASALKISPQVLHGDHDHISAFADADAVLPLVEAHLGAIGTW